MGIANIAAQIHANMCNDDRFGYSWEERWGGPSVVAWEIEGRTYRIDVGDFDCSSSTIKAWQMALEGTPYEGILDGATYTGNMRAVFEASGLFYSSYEPATRGDLYLNDANHVAMCQDGGADGVFGYDCLSEFCWGDNGAYGNQRGDQSGYEAYIHGYYDYPWNAALHYNGKADGTREEDKMPEPQQIPGEPLNDAGFRYRVHVQNMGWQDWVHDGQTAGTTGFGLRMEAIQIDPPSGKYRAKAHIQNIGWRTYDNIVPGNDVVIGTVGQGLRLEMLIIEEIEPPTNESAILRFRVHQQDVGWKAWTPAGYASGSDAEAMRLEAFQLALAR